MRLRKVNPENGLLGRAAGPRIGALGASRRRHETQQLVSRRGTARCGGDRTRAANARVPRRRLGRVEGRLGPVVRQERQGCFLACSRKWTTGSVQKVGNPPTNKRPNESIRARDPSQSGGQPIEIASHSDHAIQPERVTLLSENVQIKQCTIDRDVVCVRRVVERFGESLHGLANCFRRERCRSAVRGCSLFLSQFTDLFRNFVNVY